MGNSAIAVETWEETFLIYGILSDLSSWAFDFYQLWLKIQGCFASAVIKTPNETLLFVINFTVTLTIFNAPQW